MALAEVFPVMCHLSHMVGWGVLLISMVAGIPYRSASTLTPWALFLGLSVHMAAGSPQCRRKCPRQDCLVLLISRVTHHCLCCSSDAAQKVMSAFQTGDEYQLWSRRPQWVPVSLVSMVSHSGVDLMSRI